MTFEEWWTKKWRGASRLAIAREAWDESRENLPEIDRHTFCRTVGCLDLKNGKCDANVCQKTAMHFHQWLLENGYRIVKE